MNIVFIPYFLASIAKFLQKQLIHENARQGCSRLLAHQRISAIKYPEIMFNYPQQVRYLLEYLRMPYENKHYFSKEEWFQGDKISPPFKDNCLVNLPYLKDGARMVFESAAIPVYLAHKANRVDLFGKGVDGSVYFKQTQALVEDFRNSFGKNVLLLPKDQFQVDGGKSSFQKNCVPLLMKIDAFLCGRKFSTGRDVSLVDFALFEIEDMVRLYDEETFKQLPNVVNHFNNVSSIPEIQVTHYSHSLLERPTGSPTGSRKDHFCLFHMPIGDEIMKYIKNIITNIGYVLNNDIWI